MAHSPLCNTLYAIAQDNFVTFYKFSVKGYPQLEATGANLRDLLSKKEKIDAVLAIRHEIDTLQRRLDQVENDMDKPAPKVPEPPKTPDFELHKLCRVIKRTLEDWGYPKIESIAWDDKLGDLRINGQARTSHGKGHRAFMFSAFVIGLLRYCRANDLPHPGVVVLDSPLVTLREADSVDE